ncbi:MAG: GHKL domain-containing protein [Alphaproteobacteria bacterium]|nr:GHKL domain-containing protein [Alphaproteobacteria bacterium]
MDSFKRGYSRIIYLTGIFLVLIAVGIEYFQYQRHKEYVLIDLKNRLNEYASTLNLQARTLREYVNGLKTVAENNLFYIQNFNITSPLFPYLKNNPGKASFFLETEKLQPEEAMIGNLTGEGSLDNLSQNRKNEINMALFLNNFLEVTLKNNSGSVWAYYTSKNHFQNLYPWTPPGSTMYHRDIQKKLFYKGALPHYNPKRENFWTPAYQDGETYKDAYQKGIVITNVSPVYNGNEFLGSVALDISITKLNEILTAFNPLQGSLLLINNEEQSLATSQTSSLLSQTYSIPQLKDSVSPEILQIIRDEIKNPKSSFFYGESSLVYIKGIKDAPWHLIYIGSTSDLFRQAFLEALEDIFIIMLTLLFVVGLGYLIVIRDFISPAQKLVNHITNENDGIKSAPQGLPPMWRPWFNIVSRIFQENRMLMTNLEEQVSLRTKQLAKKNQQLEKTLMNLKKAQNQIIIQEKLASLGALTAGIAHEIKNPLNFIINFTEVSQEYLNEIKKRTPQEEELFSRISQNLARTKEHAERADSIVKGMLAHARGSTGEITTFNLNTLIDKAIDLAYLGFQGQETHFSATIFKIFDPTVQNIKGSQQDLVRVFLNIINNACFAMHEKQKKLGMTYYPEIKVETHNKAKMIQIIFEDNGPGMSKAHIKKVFHPFFTTKEPGKGTGLGLSLSYDIITQQHRGHLKVESELGKSTRFIIELPKQGNINE